jgi:hypothetical protein
MIKLLGLKKILHNFCDIYIKAINIRIRSNNHFDKVGWKFVMTTFKEKTSHDFTNA